MTSDDLPHTEAIRARAAKSPSNCAETMLAALPRPSFPYRSPSPPYLSSGRPPGVGATESPRQEARGATGGERGVAFKGLLSARDLIPKRKHGGHAGRGLQHEN
jgi:hypothetical protein